ncbi:MAG TPA: alpha-glucan family phosphorylase [Solirubrobacteraceae bacterium]|nr:alpha-glucan family phosphorylase [Solirubrobacteraceae bacterium]
MQDGIATFPDGRGDLARAASELAERLPDALRPLARAAYNYRWCWTPGGPELFAAIDPERFELCHGNPVRLLTECSAATLRRAAGDRSLVARAAELAETIAADLARPSAGGERMAFLCAEYGVHVSLPVYSGGLGALAGDLLKEASDRAVPMVAVGLMYRKGYFRQRIDASGWQHEYWIDSDPQRLPCALVTAQDGAPLTIALPIYDANVTAQIWRVDVGRVPLFLLDTDLPANDALERWITGRLYEGDADTRLSQYVLLGAGGVRALSALGYDPAVVHLNEGHAALAPLQLAAAQLGSAPLDDALAAARRRTIFTTHTPVPAGNDAYPADQVRRAIAGLAAELGVGVEEVVALGRTDPGDEEQPFGVTQAALRMSRAANAVSSRHGEVAREMWHALWPQRSVQGVPIGHVTNGVHVPSWIGAPIRELLERHVGQDWMFGDAVAGAWEAIGDVPPAELWQARSAQRAELIAFLRRRSTADRLARGDVREYVLAAQEALDPDVLTIGFARRVATYKRLDLLTRDPEWTLGLLGGDRPVQVVLAGKAHPRDDEAKRVLQRLFGLKYARQVAERVVFLDDYDLAVGARLVRGCDVWLNVPRPPLEASGTSGMKSAINGGLQLSVLDGWWAEAFDGHNGWAISGEIDHDAEAQDARHAAELHRALDEEVVPAFYERDADGLPARWLETIARSMMTLGPRFAATRMLADYVSGPYGR